jgi:putative MATE family efflux protein
LISSAILISLPPLLDSYLVSGLNSNTTYGALGMAVNFIHFLIKLSESIPVAAMAIIGRYNGSQDYDECGRYIFPTIFASLIIGVLQFVLIFVGAGFLFSWLGVPSKMMLVGIPFLKLKSFGALLTFVAMALIGFMRAVKNTRVPMMLNLVGVAVYIFFDVVLIHGNFGFAACGLQGPAIASIIQYTLMVVISLAYIFYTPEYKKYFVNIPILFFDMKRVLNILKLSWPIIIDKGTLALSYVWLSKMIASMGKYAIVTFSTVKDFERFALLPAVAGAQIVTFLVSNRLGAKDKDGAMANIKKILIFTGILEIIALSILSLNSGFFVSFFDPKNKFTLMAAAILPLINMLVIFDFIQLILAGALRGAGDVKAVMWIRFISCTFFFVPISTFFSSLSINNQVIKFTLVYGSFYFNTAVMGLIFLYRIKTRKLEK